MNEQAGNEIERKRIAVVAIHGVGDHPQFATAREIGDLLSNLEYKPGGSPRYAPFTEVMKRIHVRPVRVEDPSLHFDWTNRALQKNTWGPMDALAQAAFKNELRATTEAKDSGNSVNTLDHLFMKGQLIKYVGEHPEDTYQCLRLEGKRVSPVTEHGAPVSNPMPDAAGKIGARLREGGVDLPEASASPGTQEKLVHIYEMHWADLSRLGNAFTQVFGELYQLLFHLGTVSVNNVLAAAIHFHGKKGGKQWRIFSQAQWFSAAILAWPIPIVTLLMAALAPAVFLVSVMRSEFSARTEYLTLDALVTLLLIAGSGYALSRVPKLPYVLYRLPMLLLGVLAIAAAFYSPRGRDGTEEVFAAVIVALSFAGVWLIVRSYEGRRPGSQRAAAMIFAIFVLAAVLTFSVARSFPAGRNAQYPALAMCLNVMEIAFGLLTVSWIVFYLSYAWAHVAGAWAVHAVRSKSPDDLEYVKARRARWTAQLVLALSSVVFIVLTLLVWTGIIKIAERLLPTENQAVMRYEPVGAVLYDSFWRHGLKRLSEQLPTAMLGPPKQMEHQSEKYLEVPPPVSDWADQMLSVAGIGFLPILLGAGLLALLCAAWAMFPSVLGELRPPSSGSSESSAHERNRANQKMEEQSIALGTWLNRGFSFMRWGGKLLYWVMWLPPFLFLFLNLGFIFWVRGDEAFIKPVIDIAGALVAGTAIGIFGFAGRFKSLARAFRPLIRVMLDVDNWLREHPRSSNPTARICGRYISLLRNLCAWREEATEKPYDAIVIVAHSQGTVITADFLRFLEAEKSQKGSMRSYDPELELFDKLPIYFFTMGCPLHQLYGLRFPHLYGWARDDVRTRQPGKVPDIGPNDVPRPEDLGVTRWVNAYRSGDYVGRYLWRGGEASYDWHPASTSYDTDWDPPAGKPEKISADQAGKRIEFCIGPGAHTHYWDHTAVLVAEVLDRLINNA